MGLDTSKTYDITNVEHPVAHGYARGYARGMNSVTHGVLERHHRKRVRECVCARCEQGVSTWARNRHKTGEGQDSKWGLFTSICLAPLHNRRRCYFVSDLNFGVYKNVPDGERELHPTLEGVKKLAWALPSPPTLTLPSKVQPVALLFLPIVRGKSR